MSDTGYQYDAFISYRHKELDIAVAKALHRQIESFGIPGDIRRKTGKQKMGRVFRDQDELPLLADLGEGIVRALEQSRWLIVICSPDLPLSKWCMAEVDAFIKMGRRDRILTILISGEPEESFPPQLLTETLEDGTVIDREPLAADIRAGTTAASLKLLKREKLRLIAPILGVTFDSLYQRHRRRMVRIAATATACALVVLTGVGVGYRYLTGQVREQEQVALANDSLAMAERALTELAGGNRLEAIRTALAALPSDLGSPSRPYVKEAEHALYKALLAYPQDSSRYKVAYDTRVDKLAYSGDGELLFAADYRGEMHVLRAFDGTEITSFNYYDKAKEAGYSVTQTGEMEMRINEDGSRIYLRNEGGFYCFAAAGDTYESSFEIPVRHDASKASFGLLEELGVLYLQDITTEELEPPLWPDTSETEGKGYDDTLSDPREQLMYENSKTLHPLVFYDMETGEKVASVGTFKYIADPMFALEGSTLVILTRADMVETLYSSAKHCASEILLLNPKTLALEERIPIVPGEDYTYWGDEDAETTWLGVATDGAIAGDEMLCTIQIGIMPSGDSAYFLSGYHLVTREWRRFGLWYPRRAASTGYVPNPEYRDTSRIVTDPQNPSRVFVSVSDNSSGYYVFYPRSGEWPSGYFVPEATPEASPAGIRQLVAEADGSQIMLVGEDGSKSLMLQTFNPKRGRMTGNITLEKSRNGGTWAFSRHGQVAFAAQGALEFRVYDIGAPAYQPLFPEEAGSIHVSGLDSFHYDKRIGKGYLCTVDYSANYVRFFSFGEDGIVEHRDITLPAEPDGGSVYNGNKLINQELESALYMRGDDEYSFNRHYELVWIDQKEQPIVVERFENAEAPLMYSLTSQGDFVYGYNAGMTESWDSAEYYTLVKIDGETGEKKATLDLGALGVVVENYADAGEDCVIFYAAGKAPALVNLLDFTVSHYEGPDAAELYGASFFPKENSLYYYSEDGIIRRYSLEDGTTAQLELQTDDLYVAYFFADEQQMVLHTRDSRYLICDMAAQTVLFEKNDVPSGTYGFYSPWDNMLLLENTGLFDLIDTTTGEVILSQVDSQPSALSSCFWFIVKGGGGLLRFEYDYDDLADTSWNSYCNVELSWLPVVRGQELIDQASRALAE